MEFGENNAISELLRRSRSFKVTDVGTDRKPVCDFLLITRWHGSASLALPECFKDDNASQWKSGKFDPRSLKNPRTDRHLNLHG